MCLTYNLPLPLVKGQPRRRTTQCFAVGDLISAVGSLVDDVAVASSTQGAYCHALQGHLAERPIESSIEDKRNLLQSAVVQSAEKKLLLVGRVAVSLIGSLIVRVLWSPLLLIVTIFTVVGSSPGLTQITKLLLQAAETPV